MKTESQSLSKQETIQHNAIKKLEVPLSIILESLRDRIENGEYCMIVGDDASGRIPTLIMANVMKQIYQKKGLPPPEIRFFAGSTGLGGHDEGIRSDKIKQIAEGVRSSVNNRGSQQNKTRILFVTDTIATGRTTKVFAKAFQELGIDFDIATIALLDPEESTKKFGHLIDPETRIAYGQDEVTPEIYTAEHLSGVNKRSRDVHAKPAYHFGHNYSTTITEARQDAKIIARHLLHHWENGSLRNGVEGKDNIEAAYASLMALKEKIIGKNFGKESTQRVLIYLQKEGAYYLYDKFRENNRLDDLRAFVRLYDGYKDNPLFMALIHGKGVGEQKIVDFILLLGIIDKEKEDGIDVF